MCYADLGRMDQRRRRHRSRSILTKIACIRHIYINTLRYSRTDRHLGQRLQLHFATLSTAVRLGLKATNVLLFWAMQFRQQPVDLNSENPSAIKLFVLTQAALIEQGHNRKDAYDIVESEFQEAMTGSATFAVYPLLMLILFA